ncbi:hypothetical protein P885DRAFT_44078 [Corynascus similis CBS 632.67]
MATSVDPIYATPGPFTEFPGKGLPDIKRYITPHNAQGEGVFLPSDTPTMVINILYITQGAAVDLNGEVDIALARENKVSLSAPSLPGLHVPGGTFVRVIDFAPGVESPMHRAMSLDYGTVIQGEFEVELDSGEKRTMRPGDVLVQRATKKRR